MAAVIWGPSGLTYAGTQRVYIRARWADDWTYQGNIWCEEATLSLLPSMPTASFVLHYGIVIPHGGTATLTQAKLNLSGWYVKVEFDTEDGTITWVGFIDQVVDLQGGVTGSIPSGTQRFVAMSMAQVLSYEYLTRSRWHDEPATQIRWSGSAIDFNAGGMPNRSPTIPSGEETCVFTPRAPKNYHDAAAWTKPVYWSSRDIAKYLEEYAQPDGDLIPFRIDNVDLLPDWDRPVIQTEGKSVLTILNELANPGRLLQFSVGHDESSTPHKVVLRVHSLSAVTLSLPNGKTHPANTDTLVISTTGAQDTNLVIQGSATATVHQVVVKGAKRESLGSFSIATDENQAFVEGWTSTEQTDFNTAASGETAYSAADDAEKQRMNQVARAQARLADVFRTLVLNPNWDFDVTTSLDYLFVDEDLNRYYPWWGDIKIAPQLPIKEKLDYTTYLSTVTEADHLSETEYRPPYVLIDHPTESGSWVQVEKMSNGSDPAFSVSVGVSKEGQGVTLDVSGQYQQALANTRFVALPVDEELGSWDYLDCLMTLSLTEDRFVEFAYPADEDIADKDAIRRKIIYAGNAYKRVRMLPDTAVDVDADGSLKLTTTSNTTDGDLVNDTPALESLGMIAASWYLVPRNVLRLSSSRPSATVAVGQMLTYANPGTPQASVVNTVVSQITISCPLVDRTTPVSYTVTTATGELDVLAFAPPPPVTQVM